MAKPDAGGWRYTPALWYRTDGARVERVRAGPHAGLWMAALPRSTVTNAKYVLTDGSVGDFFGRGDVTFVGYAKAASGKDTLDAIKAERDASLAKAMRELVAKEKPPPVKGKSSFCLKNSASRLLAS